MSKLSSNHLSSRIGGEIKNSSSASASRHRRSMPIIFKRHRSAKKQLSLGLNEAEFEICQAPDDNEMIEFIQNSNPEGNNNTNQSESTLSDDTITDQQPTTQNTFNTSPTTPHRNCLITQLKHRLAPYKFEPIKRDENDHQKNNGFLLIDQIDSDLILISNENIDQQHTRHAEPCVHGQIYEDSVDINQIQLISTTPVTPSLLPPKQSSALTPSKRPLINHSNSDSDVQATQAGVECENPSGDVLTVHDTQLSLTDSSSSPSSTNSSNNDPQYTSTDRSTLDDADYIFQQNRDLERVAIYEIALNNDRRDYLQDLPENENDELDFIDLYKESIQKNLKLKEELKLLKEETARIYSPWSCEVCTYINEPYIKTRKDVCEMCEGPSPLKRHSLTS